MTATPPLTVGLPVFNGEPFLVSALESILGQTFGDFVLVVSDNASTDGTEEVCQEYSANDPRIRYVRHERNRGAAWNYNHVFEHCESLTFRWAAADDVFAPTCFERCNTVLAEAPADVAMCYTKTLVIDETGAPSGDYDDGMDLRSPKPHVRVRHVVGHIVRGNPIFGLFRADVIRKTRGHLSFPCADWVLIAEIALAGQVWEIPERLFHRRLHAATSRALHPGPEEYTAWLDPTAKPVEHERLRLLREYLTAVQRSKLSPSERAMCYAGVTAAWTRRYAVTKAPLRRLGAVARRRRLAK